MTQSQPRARHAHLFHDETGALLSAVSLSTRPVVSAVPPVGEITGPVFRHDAVGGGRLRVTPSRRAYPPVKVARVPAHDCTWTPRTAPVAGRLTCWTCPTCGQFLYTSTGAAPDFSV